MTKKEPYNSYKDLWEQSCEQIEDLCKLLDVNTKTKPADAWSVANAIQKIIAENKKYKEALQEIGWIIPKKDAPDGRMEYNAFKASKMGYIARKALGYDGVLLPNEKSEDINEPPF